MFVETVFYFRLDGCHERREFGAAAKFGRWAGIIGHGAQPASALA
jgi:hypothetical protein